VVKFRYVVGVEQKYDAGLFDGQLLNTYYGSRSRKTGAVEANGLSFLWPDVPTRPPVKLFDEPKRLLKDELLFAVRERTVFGMERFGFLFPQLNQLFIPESVVITLPVDETSAAAEEGEPWLIFNLKHDGSNDFLYRIHRGLIELCYQLMEDGAIELLKQVAESSWFAHIPLWDYRSLEGYSSKNIWYVKNKRAIPSSPEKEEKYRKFKERVREFLWDSEQIWLPWYTELFALKSYDLFLQRWDVSSYIKEHGISLHWK
jgi:hypothetical protein